MRNPQPRIRMFDGFNEGWIELQDKGRQALKGQVQLDTANAAAERAHFRGPFQCTRS